MSVIYKDRDEPRTYTTVRRYRVPDRAFEEEDTYEKQIVIKRASDRDAAARYERDRDLEYRVREREAPREVIRYEREVERAPSPPEARVREYRFERETDREPPRRDLWDLEKYTRSTEYYPQSQPIIIRQDPQPIIIQEAPRQPIVLQREEPYYDHDDRQLVRRDDAQRRRDEEDYYYERTTREVDRGPRRGGGGEDFYDERDYRRDVDPQDSASNYADDRYSSDDDVVIVRKERTDGSRDRSPHHRRHLAEGAIAGLGAAEILRHHRRKQGEDSGHRGRQLVGGAALGAVGAEALSRVRSRMRGSRSRSTSSDPSYRSSRRERRRRHRSRSRSRSHSRARTLAKLGTVAAVGALAGYALRNRGNKETVIVNNEPLPRRSRSRRRRASVGSVPPPLDARPRSESKHRDPEHRNRRIAQAGLASAAAAGILDRVRSRSRGGKRSRSKSRIRTGVPIAAAGLGGAAVAGLYERTKARKEVQRDEDFERSRSRSRSVPYPDDEHRLRRASSDPALIEYGDDPIYPDRHYEEPPAEYRRRRRGSSSSLSPDRRRHDRSSRSRSRSRSRTRGLAETAAVAGAAGVAAHELGKRNERRRSDRERRRREEEEEAMYAHDRPYSPPPVGPNAAYPPTPQGQDFYPATNSFPPPPTDNYARQADYPPQEYPPYNPADYPPPPSAAGAPHGRLDNRYGSPDPNLGYPPANETFAGDTRYAGDNRGRPGPEHVSSTFAAPGAFADPHDSASDGLNNPRPKSVQFNVPPSEGMSSPDAQKKGNPRSTDPDTDYSESDGHDDRIRTRSDLSSDGTTEIEHKRRRRRRHRHRDEDPIDENDRDKNEHHHRHHRRRRSRDRSSSRPTAQRTDSEDSLNSSETVELPPRFDQQGRKMPERGEDPLADKIEDLLSGKGLAGGILKRLTGDLLGDGAGKKRR